MITLGFQKNWNVRTPHVYRYMNKEFIECFFDTGKIRLSSFKVFSQHEDVARADDIEGRNVISVRGKNGVVIAGTQHGMNSFIFCTSMREDATLKKTFNANSHFKIVDTTMFGLSVASCLPYLIDGVEGPCQYLDGHFIRRGVESLPEQVFAEETTATDAPFDHHVAGNAALAVVGADVYFSKRAHFADQQEYRFVWNVAHEVTGTLEIDCPVARQYCEWKRE
jgi:hypothetical protein